MEIAESARRHCIPDNEILHALDNAIRYAEQEYDGELRVFVIGADSTGRLIELVLVPFDEPATIIHADILRPGHYDFP